MRNNGMPPACVVLAFRCCGIQSFIARVFTLFNTRRNAPTVLAVACVTAFVFCPIALRSAPGQLKWELPVSIGSGPVIGTNGLVYGASDQGQVYAWDATTGQTRWQTNVGGN